MKNKTIFITGGTGSFGSHFAKSILKSKNFKKLIIFSRDELKQYNLAKEEIFQKNIKKIRFLIGDVRDYDRVKLALDNVDYVVHSAALKQVPALEYNPFEAIKTNILGTQNLISASLESKVSKFLLISTDKAVTPINLYGATKLCAEKITLSANNYTGSKKTIFSVSRYGNVFGSRGSVIHLFLEYIKNGKTLPITDSKMTRFNMQLNDCFKFVTNSLLSMKGGEIFVPNLKSYRIIDLVSALKKIYGNRVRTEIVGLRPSEKIHEELISNHEGNRTIVSKNLNTIYPENVMKNLQLNLKNFKNTKSYNSLNNKFLTVNELVEIIKKFKYFV